MHRASPEIDAVLAPLREETDRVDRELADNRAFLDERRRRGLDAETRALLHRAAESPTAPESLRRLAREVGAGRLSWDDVFARRAGADGEAFLADAFGAAREHFADADLAPVSVPDEALAVGVDPEAVAADLQLTLAVARIEHDAIYQQTLDGPPFDEPAP
ncbi:hypothetical protein [Nocardioides cynanchi]|uniref:hypothetical protein n=1 Tax=Nocardioides cynanchi TaxID=2558918 RepID=UPI0012473788|nr:hypothetical protein [Nocardioides cynanchi]